MNLHGAVAAAAVFCLAAASATGQTGSYDWGQGASRAPYGQATSSDSYDWGQSAVDNAYYGRQTSSSSASLKHRSILDSPGGIDGEKKAQRVPSLSAGAAPQPANSDLKIAVPGMDR